MKGKIVSALLQEPKKGINVKNLGRNPPSQTPPIKRPPDPANSLFWGLFFFKIQERGLHKECRGGVLGAPKFFMLNSFACFFFVPDFFTLFRTFPHFFTLFRVFRTIPPELFLRIEVLTTVLVQRDEKKRIKENKKKRTNPFCTLVVAHLSSSELLTLHPSFLSCGFS